MAHHNARCEPPKDAIVGNDRRQASCATPTEQRLPELLGHPSRLGHGTPQKLIRRTKDSVVGGRETRTLMVSVVQAGLTSSESSCKTDSGLIRNEKKYTSEGLLTGLA
ncbi:hypothetical protein ElyMa_006529900 [Elysia marginata]|uniref:Uncharacterized protein n=1 Tax=Elysia marginata TaxID=1093978 RepID=A0AAV4I5Y5_9GAST|nr:hypothetical protein ElyMa_006529900 [Elysia marginata]